MLAFLEPGQDLSPVGLLLVEALPRSVWESWLIAWWAVMWVGFALFTVSIAPYVMRLADKQERVQQGAFGALDHFPCWYCVKYLGKVAWLTHFPQHPWVQGNTTTGRHYDPVGTAGASAL